MELQQMKLKERELHQTWLARFTKLKTHLEFLHNNRFTVGSIIEQYETAFRILFQEECQTFRLKIHQNLNQLQWQLEIKIPHSSPTKSCLKVLRTSFKEFFDSKDVTAFDFHNKGWQKHFTDYMGWKLDAYRHILLCGIESENSGSTTPLRISDDENRGSDKDRSSSMNECNRSGNENKCSDHESTNSGNDANADIGPSYDSDTMTKNNSNIIFDIPNMDPDRDKEEHDDVDYEQQRSFFASLINNLKCDVEKCNEVNRKAQQANALLTNELERYKENEKYFAKDMTNESEYCKKIKLLNDEISNLKSQACEKDKTFAKENEKYNEYNELEKKIKNLLSNHKIISEKELKCKAEKRLKVKQRKSPLSYYGFVYVETQFEEPLKVPLKRRNVNLKKHLEQTHNLKEHLEQAQLKDIDPKLWNSLLMKYICYVKQAMIKFEKQTFSKLQLNQDELFIMDFEQSINMRVRNRWSDEFEPLVKNVNLQLNCFEMSLVKEMKDDLKYVMSLEDEFDETCLILDIQQEFFKTQFESVKSESYSHMYEKEMKFSKEPQVFETLTSQKAFKSVDSTKEKHVLQTPKSHSTPIRQVWRQKQIHSKLFKYSKSEMLSLQNKNDSSLIIPNSGRFQKVEDSHSF
ncbi:hypothetical protein Tco_0564690 [Tanacetum coccineum]